MEKQLHSLKLREKSEAGRVAVLEAEKNLQAMTRKKEQVERCILEQLQALQKVRDQLNSMDTKQKATEQKAINAELKMKQLQENMERLRTERSSEEQGMREHLKELRKMMLEAEEKAVTLAGEKGTADVKVNYIKTDITKLINQLHSGKKAGVKSEEDSKAKAQRKMETKKGSPADDATLKAAKRQRSDGDTKRTKDPERQKKKDDGEKPKTKEAQSTEARTHVSNFNEDLRRLL